MALVVNDRVKETSTTTGTGTLTLAGAVSGFETFSSAIGNTNTTYYSIVNSNGEFEVGLGTVSAGALSRDTIISSSNSDAAVNFSAGTKNVFCTLPASKAVILDASGNIVANNGSNLTNLNADNLASGTVPDARFPATLPAASGANLTALNATQLTSGTVPDARFPATLPAANGSALTNLNASNLATGTVANARLDADLAAIGGLTSAADKGIQFTGSGTAGTFDLTTAGKALLDDADAAAQRTTLGLGSIAQLNTVTLTTDTTGDYVASLTAGTGITGDGTGEGSTPTIALDLNELTTSVSDTDGDFFPVVDSLGGQKKLTKGSINISGFNNDSGFIDGSSLNASNLDSGTIPDARFPATLPAASGANLTNLNGSNISSGTVPNARLDQQLQDVAGLAVTDGNFIVGNGANFVAESGATARTSLGLGSIAELNTVTLTTNTTGDYVESLTAGNLIDLQNNSGEGATPTIDVDLSELTTSTSDADGDFFAVVDSANAQKKLTKGNIAISGFNNDSGFIDGSSLNADNLSSGTVPDARFPATLPAASGANLTALNATQLTSGTVPDARFPATLPAISGANLTNLDASDLASGTVPIARIDLNLLTTSTADADGDFFVVVDSVGAEKKLTKANIAISGFNNDSGFTTNTGTVTSVSGGDGLTGSVTTSGSLAVGAGTLIDVTADAVNVDLSELTTSTSDADGDFFVVVDSVNAQKKLTKANIAISGFNNDSGFTTNTGTVTSVTGGNGLTGSVTTSGSLDVGAGTGIDVAADSISVDVSDFMTNGSNNRVLTATGTDAMNAEANMTFDGSTLAVTGAITATGDVTAFYTSDKNLKQNIVNIDNSLDKVSKLNGVYYNWTKEALEKNKHLVDEKEVGVIAQDVEAVLPELVATREDGSKAVRYERLCAVLIESIKELKKEIEELKK